MTKIQFSTEAPETLDREGFEDLEWKEIRTKPIRPNELLYDDKGNPVAIKSSGKILPIIKGDL